MGPRHLASSIEPRSLRILVLEDSKDTRDGLCLMLEWRSFAVDTATDAETACALPSMGNYDVIIVDLKIPYINGLEVGRVIAQRSPRPLLYAFSACASAPDREQTKLAGFDRHIAKGSPTSITELEAAISQLKSLL